MKKIYTLMFFFSVVSSVIWAHAYDLNLINKNFETNLKNIDDKARKLIFDLDDYRKAIFVEDKQYLNHVFAVLKKIFKLHTERGNQIQKTIHQLNEIETKNDSDEKIHLKIKQESEQWKKADEFLSHMMKKYQKKINSLKKTEKVDEVN